MAAKTIKFNLKALLTRLIGEVPNIAAIYLFGSRVYGTGSLRSDCDLLLRVTEGRHVRSSDLRDFAMEHCAALDFFVAEGGHATSCMNDSFVYAATFEELTERLDALLLWDAATGFQTPPVEWVFETSLHASFTATILPDSTVSELSWQTLIKKAEQLELPVAPYIGDTIDKATAMITHVAKAMILNPSELCPKGAAKDGWTVNLKSEYDCQNLFYSVVKPWIPNLGREEVTITYDGQEKIADFNLFGGKLIVEFKFIDSEQKKREVVKTLDGLSRFYSRNGNIRVLLLLLFVKAGTSLDAARWISDYTFYGHTPKVITDVIVVP